MRDFVSVWFLERVISSQSILTHQNMRKPSGFGSYPKMMPQFVRNDNSQHCIRSQICTQPVTCFARLRKQPSYDVPVPWSMGMPTIFPHSDQPPS